MAVAGFIHLINLYKPFDDTFTGWWNRSRSDCTIFWLVRLQEQLVKALPSYLNVTEIQAADIRISQQWLRVVVWQLSIANDYLSPTSTDPCMTFRYPIEVAKDLVTITTRFSQDSMEVHGFGLASILEGGEVITSADMRLDRKTLCHSKHPFRCHLVCSDLL